MDVNVTVREQETFFMTLRCSMLVAALATAVCQGAQAQTIDRLDLDYRSAQARLLERSDAIQGADIDALRRAV